MKPLENIKVLDFTQFFAGPICTLLMADMGADIIKLENPPGGDATRYTVAIQDQKSSNFTTRNRGKKSVIMNLKDPAQKAIFLKMVKDADVVIENFKPGTLEKYGITYDVLKAINPRIVYTSISGYGQYGPYRDHAAYDGAVQGEGGIISVTGDENGKPVRCGTAIADATAGLIGCIGTLSALYGAKITGVGRRVDVSMLDSMVTIMENLISSYFITGTASKPVGNRMYSASPFNTFTCKDGVDVMIGISTNKQFEAFCNHVVNKPEWLKDERFTNQSDRVANYKVMEELTAQALKEINSADLCASMQEYKLVYGKINTVADLIEHPQVLARHMLVNAVYTNGTTFKVPGCPIKMSDVEEADDFRTPEIGEDTFDVLKEYADEVELHGIYDSVFEACAENRRKMFAH